MYLIRHTVLLGGLVVAWCVLSGCRQQGGDLQIPRGGLTVAVVPKSTGGEFWETVEQGARAAAADLSVQIKWEGTLTETEIAEQTRIIENMINLGVDGMAIAPLNAKATVKPIQNAIGAGIPVVIFDSAMQGDGHVSFVATNNDQGGRLGGEHLVGLLNGKGGKVMVLRFLQGTASTEARSEGFIDVVRSAGLEVVADVYPEDGTVAGAKKTAANTLEGFIRDNQLQLDGIFAANLVSALGMAAALDDLRKADISLHAKFIGFDTSPKLLEGLQAGTIDALVAQDPKRMGYLAVETLVRHLRGERVEPVLDTGVQVVTRERLAAEPAVRVLVGLHN